MRPVCSECLARAIGSFETIEAVALFDEHGRYTGHTEVDWDSQATVTSPGSEGGLLLICSNGHRFAAPAGFRPNGPG